MPVFSISYDLIKRVDYESLWVELERMGAERFLVSQWAVRSADGVTASALRDQLSRFIDDHDRLFVTRIDNADYAGMNLLMKLNAM